MGHKPLIPKRGHVSATKKTILKFQCITSGDMSLSSLTSPVTNIQFLDNIGIQINYSGSPVGKFNVQVSADYAQDSQGNVTNAGNWASISFLVFSGSITDISVPGSTSPIYLDITQISAPWIRVIYTKTSGTGTANVFLTAKEV